MAETQTPFIGDREPTEASVCRMSLARMRDTLARMTPQTKADRAARERMVVELKAWQACLRKAGWDREPQEEQHIWNAG